MHVNCPQNWKSSLRVNSSLIIEDHQVNICNDICDCADLCGNDDCQFYDLSREASREFMKANAFEHTLEFLDVKTQWRRELELKIAREREKHDTYAGDMMKGEDDRPTITILFPAD